MLEILSNLRKFLLAGVCLFAVLTGYPQEKKPETTKRVVLSPVQAKMIQAIEQDIENVPEVKTLRAREMGIIAGIATSVGMNRWSWKTEKGEIVVEEQSEPKEEPKP